MAEIRRMRPVLGTFVEVGGHGGSGLLEGAVEAAYVALQQIHDLASFQEPDSQLSRLNRQPGDFLALHPLLILMLRLADGMGRRSQGLFDCAVGGRLVREGVLPDHGGPIPVLVGGPDDLVFRGREVCLRRPIRITLDGLAKGFAVDRAIMALRAHGLSAGWVNAGGDLRVFGDVRLPIQRREANGALTELGLLHDAAMASSATCLSGDGMADGRFPGRIVAAGVVPAAAVWTVLARKAWRADALTKVAALAPAQERMALVASLGGFLVEEIVMAAGV